MAKDYKLGILRRLVNRLATRMVGRNKGDERMHLLTTIGRRSGVERSTPITLVKVEGVRWLVAPYGAVGWVHNIRETGTATLTRGAKVEKIVVSEASAEEAAPVLAHYLQTIPVVRPFFDVAHDASLSDIAQEAHQHPVFRIS